MQISIRAVFAAGIAFAFSFMAVFSEALPAGPDNVFVIIALALCAGGLAYLVCTMMKGEKLILVGLALLAVCLGMVLRYNAFYHMTADYYHFLAPWAENFREHGWRAITTEFSDYNMPYLYIVAIIAKIPVYDLYVFKLVSVIFDCALVLAAMRLGKTLGLSGMRIAALAAAVWLAPTVWLNSAFWSQCDAIYVFFILMALTTALEDKPVPSMIFAAVAFSFKLQTIFFLPLYVVLWMGKRVKLWHFGVFPAAYLVTILPAWVSGKPLLDILKVYVTQTGTYSDHLNMNSASMYALLWTDGHHDVFFRMGLIMAAFFVCAVLAFMYLRRDRLTPRAIMLCALLFAAGIPWLLPSMHDRYFYLADILCIVIAMFMPRRWYLAPLCVFSSYAGYHAYLFLAYIPYIGLVFPALFMLFIIGTAGHDLWRELTPYAPDELPPAPNVTVSAE